MTHNYFDENGFALERFDVVVHGYSSLTGEFTESYQTVIPMGCGLPSNTTTIEPLPAKEGFVSVFDVGVNNWDYIEDNRNRVYFLKDSGVEVSVNLPGPAPDTVTESPKPGPFHFWCYESDAWVCDSAAELASRVAQVEEEKASLMAAASAEVTALGYGQDLRGLNAEEYKRLNNLKRYVFDLYKLDVSNPDEIVWPIPV